MEKLVFYICLPFSFLAILLTSLLQIPKVWKRYKEEWNIENILEEMISEVNATLSWYLNMPDAGKVLVALFFYSLIVRIFI